MGICSRGGAGAVCTREGCVVGAQIHPQAVRAVTWHVKVAVDGVSVGVERHGGGLGLPRTHSLLFPLVPFMIGLALAADVALAVENGLNAVIVSDGGR
jgi:hypothetical protein